MSLGEWGWNSICHPISVAAAPPNIFLRNSPNNYGRGGPGFDLNMKSGHNPISVQLENAWKRENFGTGRGGSPRLLWQIKGETPFPYEAASPARWKRYSTQSFIFDRSKITKLLQTYFTHIWIHPTFYEIWTLHRACALPIQVVWKSNFDEVAFASACWLHCCYQIER